MGIQICISVINIHDNLGRVWCACCARKGWRLRRLQPGDLATHGTCGSSSVPLPVGFAALVAAAELWGKFRCISLAGWQDFLNVRSILNVKTGGKRGAPYSLPHWNARHLPQNFIASLRKQFSLHFLYASWQNYCFKFDSNGYSSSIITHVFPRLGSRPQSTLWRIRIQEYQGPQMNNGANSSSIYLSFDVSKLKTSNRGLKPLLFKWIKISMAWQSNTLSLTPTVI